MARPGGHHALRRADVAEAVFVGAAGTVPGSEKVQLVDHVVVATDKGLIDAGRLEDRQVEGSFHELPTLPVVDEHDVAGR